MKSGIYMIINLSNNKVYVGSSKDISRRLKEHIRHLKNNKHENIYLQNSYNKYSQNMFKFIPIEYCELNILIERENFWIKLKNSNIKEFGYNLSIPLEQGGCNFSEKSIEKIKRSAYERHHGKLTEEEYQQKLIKKEEYNNRQKLVNKKKVFAFNKITGIKEFEFESIIEAVKQLRVNTSAVEKALLKNNATCKNFILVKEENYDPNINYIKNYKTKVYEAKGKFEGKKVETFNLETQEIIKQYSNTQELADEYNMNKKYVYKVLSGERKSFKGLGIRYS